MRSKRQPTAAAPPSSDRRARVVVCSHNRPPDGPGLPLWPLQCTQRVTRGRHRFSFRAYWDSLAFVAHNGFTLIADGVECPVQEHDLIYFRQGHYYEYQSVGAQSFTLYGISFSIEGDWSGECLGFAPGAHVRRVAAGEPVAEAFHKFHAYFGNRSIDPWRVYTNLFAIFALCMNRAPAPPRGRTAVETVALAKRLMQERIGEQCPIGAIASGTGITHKKLIEYFKAVTGQTPIQAWEDIRIEQVKSFLSETDYKILWIARNCGFAHEAYFYRCFQNKTGSTPARWRQQHRRRGGKEV